MAKNLPLDIQNKVALAISEGLITGVKHFAQFGYNPNLSSGVEAAMWSGPTPLYVFPNDAGESMRLKGGNVADNQTMLIQALDQDWNEVNIPLALNGIAPVVIPGNLARINRVINIDSTEIIGDATVTNSAGTVIYAVILAAEQITTQVIFSVPVGLKAKLETALVSLNRSGGADTGVIFRYRRRDFGGVFGTGARFGLNKKGTSAKTIVIEGVSPLNPKSDVVLLASADNNTTDVSARTPFTLYKV